MSQPQLKLYSFFDGDRSGKVRWTACELGYEIEEQRVPLGQHGVGDYLRINAMGQIPAAELDDKTLVESTAICRILARRDSAKGLIPDDDDLLDEFDQICAMATESLEAQVVTMVLVKSGYVDEKWAERLREPLLRRLNVLVEKLPQSGHIVGEDFTLADIFVSYVLRIAVQADLIEFQKVEPYLGPLMERPSAVEARFFDPIERG